MRLLFLISALGLLTGCGESPKEIKRSDNETTLTPIAGEKSYPEALNKVFEAHGGLDKWRRQQTLSFRMPGEETSETHTIDLYSRKDRVEGPSYAFGFDGEQVWLADKGGTFEGDPEFYHNLMFYFYAMPFVLADEGIVYGTVDDLVFEGKKYPGISINYKKGVGTSPKDEYYLYYEPDTHIMAWLGYTVTYFSDAPSDDLHWIRYDNWMDVNGMLVPGSMTWYNYEGRTIKDAGDTVSFNNVMLSEDPMPAAYYNMPQDARPAKGGG